MDDSAVQRIKDEEHLRLLSIFHYVSAGITGFFSIFFLMYLLMGAMFLVPGMSGASSHDETMALRLMGLMFSSMGLIGFAVGIGFASLKAYAGYCLATHRKRTYCLVVAALSLLGFPYSTLLGLFTLIVLLRDSVVRVFEGRRAGEAAG